MVIGPIAAVSFDAIIGIIAVVVWLIVQGASKRGGANAPKPPRPPSPEGGEPVNPQDDLRRFFEELEKGIAGRTSPPEPQAPELPPTPPPLAPVRQPARTMAKLHGRTASSRQPPTPPPVRHPPVTEPTTDAPKAPTTEFSWDLSFPETASAITTLRISDTHEHSETPRVPSPYHSRKALRQMIVGAEVLGKPVALRRSLQPVI